jgi:tRNA U34 5-methylaminomethyl-2-thiouridine-forming methyltransferase MnmC
VHTVEIEHTADGSATLFVKEMDEHYHSVKGALTESNHIFRDSAFLYRADGSPLRLLEVGFGTGLNAAVTAMVADTSRPVHYITLEKYPVSEDILRQLSYGELVDSALLSKIHAAPWDEPVEVIPGFILEKRQSDYTEDLLPEGIDVVYFDAFAPEKQPDMWTQGAFERLVGIMNRGCVLTTYCSKGEIRRRLESLGLRVERIPGPPGGKREILRATRL